MVLGVPGVDAFVQLHEPGTYGIEPSIQQFQPSLRLGEHFILHCGTCSHIAHIAHITRVHALLQQSLKCGFGLLRGAGIDRHKAIKVFMR